VAALIASTAARRSPGQIRAAAARLASPTKCAGPLPMFSMISRAASSGSKSRRGSNATPIRASAGV